MIMVFGLELDMMHLTIHALMHGEGQSGLTNPGSQSTTAYSGNFGFEQSQAFINALLAQSFRSKTSL